MLILLDEEDAAGQVTAAGDEVTFIQKIDAESFAGIDFVFFAGDAETTRKYWKTARLAGASIIDMTYALEGEPGVVVRGPWAECGDAYGGRGASRSAGARPDDSGCGCGASRRADAAAGRKPAARETACTCDLRDRFRTCVRAWAGGDG